jgi:uncharacterized membrane protein
MNCRRMNMNMSISAMDRLTPLRCNGGMTKTILATATLLTGLSAGLFTTFTYAVMPGLRRTSDATFVQAMRAINVAILNPVFGLIFGGAFVVAAAALVMGWPSSARPWLIAGVVLYVLGAFVITAAINVPLNDTLEAGKDSPAALRSAFEHSWVLWNHVRAVLTTAAFGSLVVGLLKI